ncbi:MAG: polysaccharide biosynthesis/export family protein [Verrucomicrobiota bacterium]
MREQAELSIAELRQKRSQSNHRSSQEGEDSEAYGRDTEEIWAQSRPRGGSISRERFEPYSDFGGGDETGSFRLPFDPARLLEALKSKWHWCFGAGLLVLAVGLFYTFGITRSTVNLQLIRRDSPILFKASEAGESFKPQQFNGPTLVALVKSPEVLRRTSVKANPPVSPGKLSYNLLVAQQPETDLVTLTLKGSSTPQQTVNLLNLYAVEFVAFTKEMQSREANGMVAYTTEKLEKVEKELVAVDEEMKKMPPEARVSNSDKLTESYLVRLSELELKYGLAKMDVDQNNPVNDKLQAAQVELAGLLVKYTEAHPQVQDQRLKIKTLEAEKAQSGTNILFGAPKGRVTEALGAQTQSVQNQAEQLRVLRNEMRAKLNGLSERSLDFAMIKTKFQSLEIIRASLASRQREAQLFAESALGYFQVFTPASLDRVSTRDHVKKGILISVIGALFGMVAMAGLVLLVEVFDERIKTASDLTRVTELPLLATLGNLDKMSEVEKSNWAFRTWTILKGKLSSSQTDGMVCGFMSATHGEGCTTWVNMLIKTANQRGLRVLTVATKPNDEPAVHPHEFNETEDAAEPGSQPEPTITTSLSTTAFSFPAQVSQQLSDPNSHSVVHIPLPGWVWNLERRQQWQTALDHWRKIDNLVILVELPPASSPESILLAEKVPQMIWLTDSGKITVHETRSHLETLRHAGCNLVGTVLNREPASFWKRHIIQRFGLGALFFAMSFASLHAAPAEEDVIPSLTNSFSVVSPNQRANWQKRLTLGPGDILNLGFYGETNLTKNDVVVRPDGRISYLQAHDVVATGLTVEELRDKLNQELAKYYRSPRVLVAPVAFNSKKYYVLGKVMNKGAFTLDRPMTVLEAVARAQGLETGLLNRNSVDLADMDKSFLMRDGKRVPIDFAKLFERGDLSQNIPIEPNDYLYFPASILKEVYVLGEVRNPGVVAFNSDSSVITALTERGWFTEKAYKSHVLIVRGSLNHPETFIVDTRAMVDARGVDFKLQPKDIVYVSKRPFIKAEELLDVAATSFIQSAVTAYSGGNVGPFITRPLLR